MLQHLLQGDHGLRLGVVVNDLASVNIDALVLDQAVKMASARTIELTNGCVCCSASDDLRESIVELTGARPSDVASPPLDAIVVELSGIAEPRAARSVLDDLAWPALAHVARVVTVVDTPAFAEDFQAMAAPGPGQGQSSAERLSVLLAEQIEAADVVVLNKADAATAAELEQAEALARELNPSMELLVAQHGQVPVQALIPAVPEAGSQHTGALPEASAVHGHGHEHGCGHAHSHERGDEESCGHAHGSGDRAQGGRTSAQRRFGVGSFVYRAERPLSRLRLAAELREWQAAWRGLGRVLRLEPEGSPPPAAVRGGALAASERAGGTPLAAVLRSKGLVWMDTMPGDAGYWGHAGRALRLHSLGPWGCAAGAGAGPAGGARAAESSTWPPRVELVFIGVGMDEGAIRARLDGCLLTDEEFAPLRGLQWR